MENLIKVRLFLPHTFLLFFCFHFQCNWETRKKRRKKLTRECDKIHREREKKYRTQYTTLIVSQLANAWANGKQEKVINKRIHQERKGKKRERKKSEWESRKKGIMKIINKVHRRTFHLYWRWHCGHPLI